MKSPLPVIFLSRWLPVLVILFICAACEEEHLRPANVPADAVFVSGSKAGWWQHCTGSANDQPVHCSIWNKGGKVLEDEEFLPYDEGPPPTLNELKLDPEAPFAGPDRIFLTNNRIILPKSRFAELKRFVDWLKGESEIPR